MAGYIFQCMLRSHRVYRRVVEPILMDDGSHEEIHLDVRRVNAKSQNPLQINIDTKNGIVSGHFFNFHNHKPTFKLEAKDQANVSLTGGPLTAPYVMDQLHFHVYCTRTEAEQHALDRAQVPGELHLVFFRKKYHSYDKAVHRFQDGIAAISIYLEVGQDVKERNNRQIEMFSSFVDYISRNGNHTLPTTASIKQLAAPVFTKHAQYDAYRGNIVEPVKCSDCVDVLVMKERITLSVKQMKEFRKAPHCVENDWGF